MLFNCKREIITLGFYPRRKRFLIMIKLVSEKEVKERHRILCPHRLQILDLIFQIQISRLPGELHLSVKLWNELKGFENLERGIFQSLYPKWGKILWENWKFREIIL